MGCVGMWPLMARGMIGSYPNFIVGIGGETVPLKSGRYAVPKIREKCQADKTVVVCHIL